jgi:hypothetical protein
MNYFENFKQIVESGIYLYIYCTDFVLNLANILSLSYYEVNFIIFCVLYPLALILSFIIYVALVVRIKKRILLN